MIFYKEIAATRLCIRGVAAFLQRNRRYAAHFHWVAAFLQRNRRYAARYSWGCRISTKKSELRPSKNASRNRCRIMSRIAAI
jgi:hypothetical protein